MFKVLKEKYQKKLDENTIYYISLHPGYVSGYGTSWPTNYLRFYTKKIFYFDGCKTYLDKTVLKHVFKKFFD